MKINTSNILRIVILLLFVGAMIFFYSSSPKETILLIGIENSYVLMFVLALIGGLTTFSGIPYHLALIMLASGGLNPLILGIITAVGVIAGDTTSYYLGHSAKAIVPQKIQNILHRFFIFCLNHQKILPIIFFLYGALSPLSNDFIAVSMGLARYPFWRVIIPLGLGNLVFNISLAYLAVYAYDLLKNVLLYI